MARPSRNARGGVVYHVLNRGVARMTLFESDEDYAVFEASIGRALEQVPTRILSYCVMPDHFHMLLYPQRDGELSEFMRLLTVTHTQRWHQSHASVGTGPIYQGRFRSFPVQRDEHLVSVAKLIESNPKRGGVVRKAEDWPWSSLWIRVHGEEEGSELLSDFPVKLPRNWLREVNKGVPGPEMEALQTCVRRGRPYGDEAWVKRTASRLGLESSLRPRGRPRKKK